MSKIEVNTVAPQCGTTLTLGESGDTVTLGAGASQSGFGRTGTVDWNTTPKTATFTAVSGDGFFANTTGSAFNMNLPAGSAGAIVSVADYAGTWQTNNLTVVPNGTDKIGGINANAVLNTEGQSVTFVFVDSTQGWINIQDSTSNVRSENFICASVSGSGNAITTAGCGNYKLATFTGPGNFTVNCISSTPANNELEYIIVAGGGGGGGQYIAGGGGAGGFRFASPSLAPLTYPGKPLAAPAGITASAQAYPISVGGGGTGNGAAGNTDSTRGISTTALGLTATGGGAGKQDQGPGNNTGQPGGSGGGGSGGNPGDAPTAYLKGSGNTPPVSPSQGNDGGNGGAPGSPAPGSGPGSPYVAGGGGGAMAVGGCGTRPNSTGGPGGVGAGVPNAFGTSGQSSGGYYYFAGGGGGNASTCGPAAGPATSGSGGLGGGGAGQPNAAGTAGTANTGGGGGGTDSRGSTNAGGNGGSGIVIIRYKFQ